MQAAVIEGAQTIRLQEWKTPSISEGEALIRVKYCGICGSDIHVLHGKHPTATFPVVPGHEFVGELLDFKGTSSLERGNLVAAQPVFSCGNCEPCAKGQDNVCQSLKVLGCHTDGGFAEYVKVPLRKVYALPDDIDLELAALIEPLAVAVHDVRRSGLKVGNSALIIGGGPIGLLIAIVARHAGADNVIISEISPYRSQAAEEMGFAAINPQAENFNEELMQKTEGKGFDVAFEVSGSKPGITAAIDYAKITGTVMVVGMTSEPYPVNLSKIFQKELTLQGVRVHSQINYIGAIDLLKSGVLDKQLRKLVSAVYPLKDVEKAFTFAQSGGDFFKILVSMED
jgi:2-desacetyl-2-hydroxyethyl bacteriochlorophyllide A dehydrogenase